MQRVQLMQVLANRTEGYSKAAYAGVSCFVDVPVDHWGVRPSSLGIPEQLGRRYRR